MATLPYKTRSFATMGDLRRLAAKNPVVKDCIEFWEAGYMSLEQMLISLACHLAMRDDHLKYNAKAMQMEWPLSYMPPPTTEG